MLSRDIQLSSASGVPFYRQIVDQISDMVRSGTLPPSSRLPSVRELARNLKVSLITIRRAYADLEHAGLLVRRRGHGTFVASDVGRAAQRQAKADAAQAIQTALDRAAQLGLSADEIETIVHKHIHPNGGHHDKSPRAATKRTQNRRKI